ncbi:MAG: hypothetical protein JO263_07365, partial [Candidatus Eremiobacteraeota bacterium]|nr:hypothetical protein [Candidatus Eremiobacteraeota bacterium]
MHKGLGRGAIAALVASLALLVVAVPAGADDAFDVGPSPVLNVHLSRGTLNIQTWDRPQVAISSDTPLYVQHVNPEQVDPNIPRQLQV